MANSEDPDQTAPLGAVWSGSALFAQTYWYHYFEFQLYWKNTSLLLKSSVHFLASSEGGACNREYVVC